MEPPPDVEQDRRPAVRTNMPPHLPPSYNGSPVHHDLKTLGSSDYAYTYSGIHGEHALLCLVPTRRLCSFFVAFSVEMEVLTHLSDYAA
jgi:hypothetical protein